MGVLGRSAQSVAEALTGAGSLRCLLVSMETTQPCLEP